MPTMYDSETPSAIPADAEIVAGYVDGQWPDYAELATTHPNAKHVSITVEGAAGADVADLEVPNFNSATIEQVAEKGAAWAKNEIAEGRRPCLYYSRSNAGVIAAALQAAGVPVQSVDFWIADWTGTAHLIPGSVATQYASPSTGSGGNYDLSETVEAWPAVAGGGPVPEPPPAPVPEPGPGPAPQPEPGGFMPPTVKQGDLSGAVRSVQALLNLHAAGLVVDGVFGAKTEQAVKNFQTVMHLTVDGIVGPHTWSALDAFG